MLSYQQLELQLQSGESQLKSYQTFQIGLKAVENHLLLLEVEATQSQYEDTIKTLIKWLDWFITETGYEEYVLIHNVEYMNRRLATYPTIELEIEERSRQIRERRRTQHNQHSK